MHITFKKLFLTSLLSLTIILTTLVIVTSIQKDIEVKKEEQERQAVIAAYAKKDIDVEKQEQERQDVNNKILESASIEPLDMSVDYTKQISTGSPLIFGGNHAPDPDQQDAWNKISDIGITSIRKDFFPENALPKNISLEDYKSNKDNIQDIQNWNQKELNRINDTYINAHKRGMKTFGIVAYAPAWLTYANKIYGVPKDWDVYEDIVKKTYKYYRTNLDYVEIWNEPNWDFFFKTENSGMSKEEAYLKIFYHASKAIREVDHEANDGKIIPIGGPTTSNPVEAELLEALLKDDTTKEKLDFASYHNYDAKHLQEPSWDEFKKVLALYGKQNLPIFITEWNYEPDSKSVSPNHTTNLAITYTGSKFVDYLKMGLSGANYHVIEPLDIKKPNRGEGYMGFYRWENGSAELLPQAKTWRLMSKDLGLGKGESKIYEIETGNLDLNALGFLNSSQEHGVVVVNKFTAQMANINFKNTGIKKYAKIAIYYANGEKDSTTPIYEGNIKLINESINLQVYIPEDTVVGVKISEEKEWFDIFSPLK